MTSTDPASGATVAPSARYRLYSVTHRTIYRYSSPVRSSTHTFRLRPVEDRFQSVEEHELEISVPGERTEFEDVFGNQTVHFRVREPYQELAIEARSVVRVHGARPLFDTEAVPGRTSIPIVWMPWQSQMMLPYLLPQELEEAQLHELSDYARSFVMNNGHDLAGTLLDIARTLSRDFAYTAGVTHLETTPFEVLRARQGVCQDFANLFICLARLERVPARYRVGYLYTGGGYDNKLQSEASHAWAEAYLPWQGWRGFDPTNGLYTDLDHIRVATGRNYRDATPTAGVITAGAGEETLEVSVQAEVLDEAT